MRITNIVHICAYGLITVIANHKEHNSNITDGTITDYKENIYCKSQITKQCYSHV